MQIMVLIVVAISLSMDAFSLSLAYGTLNLNKKNINILSCIVGIYHFVMPLLGLLIGNIILSFIKINPHIIVFIVLLFIGVEMIIESFKKQEEIKEMNYLGMHLFAFAVSIDSFSVGIGLKEIYYPVVCSICFSICSFLFTYLGLTLGKKINNLIGKISTLIGGTLLMIIGSMYII